MIRTILKKHPHYQPVYFPAGDLTEIDKIKNLINEKDKIIDTTKEYELPKGREVGTNPFMWWSKKIIK